LDLNSYQQLNNFSKDRTTVPYYRICLVNFESLDGKHFSLCCTWGWYILGDLRLAMFDGDVLFPSLEHHYPQISSSHEESICTGLPSVLLAVCMYMYVVRWNAWYVNVHKSLWYEPRQIFMCLTTQCSTYYCASSRKCMFNRTYHACATRIHKHEPNMSVYWMLLHDLTHLICIRGVYRCVRFKLPSRKATPWPFLLAQNRQIPSKNLLILCLFSWGCLALFRCFPSNVSNFWHLLRNQRFWSNFLERLGHLPKLYIQVHHI
jgi:hypothetical protein